jgi:hypothetical protein
MCTDSAFYRETSHKKYSLRICATGKFTKSLWPDTLIYRNTTQEPFPENLCYRNTSQNNNVLIICSAGTLHKITMS